MKTEFAVPEQFIKNPPLPQKLIELFLKWVKTEGYLEFFTEAEDVKWNALMIACMIDDESPSDQWRSLMISILISESVDEKYRFRAILTLLFVRENVVQVTTPGDYDFDINQMMYVCVPDQLSRSVRAFFLDIIIQFTHACEEVYRFSKENDFELEKCRVGLLHAICSMDDNLSDSEKKSLQDAYPVWLCESGYSKLPDNLSANESWQRVIVKKIQLLIQSDNKNLKKADKHKLVRQYWMKFVSPYLYNQSYSKEKGLDGLADYIRFVVMLDEENIGYLFSESAVSAWSTEKLWHLLSEENHADVRIILARMLVAHIQDEDVIPTAFLDELEIYAECDWFSLEWCQKQRDKTTQRLAQKVALEEQQEQKQEQRKLEGQKRQRAVQALLQTLYPSE